MGFEFWGLTRFLHREDGVRSGHAADLKSLADTRERRSSGESVWSFYRNTLHHQTLNARPLGDPSRAVGRALLDFSRLFLGDLPSFE